MRKTLRQSQIERAAATVKKRDIRRRQRLIRLAQARRVNPVILFYLELGTVPRSLWNEDS
jgi:hypothetical protein